MAEMWMIVNDDVSAPCLAHLAGPQAEAIVFGTKERAESVAALEGVGTVVFYDTSKAPIEGFIPDVTERALQEKPRAVVLADDAGARNVAGSIAAHCNAAYLSGVVGVSLEEGGAGVRVDALAAEGHIVVERSAPSCAVCIVADGLDEASAAASPAEIAEGASKGEGSVSLVSTEAAPSSSGDLQHAERVVGVGRGIGPKANLQLAEQLAQALRAEIACTLPLSDGLDWFEHSRVVGTSTQKISPRLYVACGVSGQPQHMTGVRGAKMIVAINKDPDAPIFRECDYGIVGDVEDVLPALTEAVRQTAE